jgi:predicted phage baseplate assembly protein
VALRPDGAPHRLDLRVVLPSGAELAGVPIVDSLLTVPPATLAAVLEIEEHEPPVLRFRTGSVGLTPPLGSTVAAAYEVGGGAAGNLAANALRVLERNAAGPGGVPAWQTVDGVVARNPVPAAGGRDAAGLAEARRDAPQAFAARPRRALLAADHAAAVSSRSEVQRAAAREWAGSWPLVRVAVDLLDDPGAPGQVGGQARVARLQALVDDLRMLGTETVAVPGAPVGLLFALEVCARPGVDPEALRRRILALLRPGEPGRPGLFHPSRLVLGGAVHSSSVLAAVAGVPGVDAVELREARRLSDPAGTVSAVLRVGPAQVAVLDDDPARPERGRLDVRVRGGR